MLRQRRSTYLMLATLLMGGASGCASRMAHAPLVTSATPTSADARAHVREELFFGLARATGRITDVEWRNFLATTVSPRFPAGLTVLEAHGQYRMANGTIIEEDSRVLVLLYRRDDPASGDRERAIGEIISDYKRRFSQESVLRVRTVVAVSL